MNSETMWSEKIQAVFKQFPWLRDIVSARVSNVKRAFVYRFDCSTLDNEARESREDVGDFLPEFVVGEADWLYFVNESGKATELGIRTRLVRRFPFIRKRIVHERYRQSARNGIRYGDAYGAKFMVRISYNRKSGTDVFVYKVSKDFPDIESWYKAQVERISAEISLED